METETQEKSYQVQHFLNSLSRSFRQLELRIAARNRLAHKCGLQFSNDLINEDQVEEIRNLLVGISFECYSPAARRILICLERKKGYNN
jgi:hypothetical protein